MSILPLSLRLKKAQRIQQGNNPLEKPKKRLLLTYRSEESSLVEKQKTKKKTQRTPQKTQSKKKKVIVEDSSPEQAQSYHGSEIRTEELNEFLRENNEKSAAHGEKEADLRSTEGHYVSSETIPDVNLGSDDPSSQGHTDQSSINKPAESIVPIQVCLPLSQTTTVAEIEQTLETENEPTPVLQIEGTTKSTLEPSPQQLEESTPTLPPTPSKINPAQEDVAALMMMARTTSYVPKTDLMPSFSLDLTDSSQEEAATQKGASTQDGGMAKTPEIPKLLKQLGDLVQKIASGGVTTKEKSPQILKESGTKSFEKFETPVCTLQAQDRYILSKLYFASLAAKTHIEAEIVSAMCFILNQQKIKRFQEEVYYLPPDIVNMAIANHPQWVFLRPKTNKPFMVEDYPMFIPFLDLKKLASHRYIFAPVCHSQHWWLWLADIRKQKFYIVNPYHTKSPSDERTALNTFISICLGVPLKTRDKDKEIVPPYLHISGQKTSYDCAIYVMKWLEIFQPTNIKRKKYEWDNWTQDEVDHFRVEYASWILFHEMNQDKAEAIKESNAIRLSKPSSLLLSPYCQIDSKDIDTD
ncbi:uncharacterized protein DS421_13g402260 [Arachis hypogaea]|nr:uncharacterized protein DS421_13g402260 [Arachis hypogaea]